ncbi:IQ calmodulin-binding motif family protein [Tritrichomonas foetus]|uniref:IQ calmodulin-binding motif family protein n=1 Tax=Tritrichomonas foetus TaxID=1144522 RepID=A0A1J4KYR7_9EUKA|nr:IQ calmodulin-binding motif family protein [Tritrichomonas foetus]|eukprot:OHT14717.1 IQ calmodulin-binding motif family protein [Tritrichomonas foetus]
MSNEEEETNQKAKRAFHKPQTGDEAAIMIQRCWRRFADVSLFRRLKTLVTFRNQGDPSTLLRVINPVEAQLLDPAVGAHVKFRLGGFEWPPQIYYKIFLHSPVCDVNSYAPRNYFDRANKDLPPINRDENGNITNIDEKQLDEISERYGWYRRVENNGWRPISSLSPTAVDMITQMTTKTEAPRALRKKLKRKTVNAEVARIKLQRFLQQQKEKGGALADGVPELTEKDLADDEILAWADDLDIRSYMLDWDTMGTTGPSSNIWWNLDEENAPNSDDESSDSSELDEEELMKLIS